MLYWFHKDWPQAAKCKDMCLDPSLANDAKCVYEVEDTRGPFY